MFQPDQYELLDFANGSKLERFGEIVVQRDTPSVDRRAKRIANLDWVDELRFRRLDTGLWLGDTPNNWQIAHGPKKFLLKPTPAGQVGVFPEQAENWDWISKLPFNLAGLKAINLFAYTGGTTMALADRGAAVTHVDAARNVVGWARDNAKASGMEKAPIRWIVDDAMKFVQREIKRGIKYDIVVADPPSFGRGPKKQAWKFERDIGELIGSLAMLANDQLKAAIISHHTVGFTRKELRQIVAYEFDLPTKKIESLQLELKTAGNKRLPSGDCVRYFVD